MRKVLLLGLMWEVHPLLPSSSILLFFLALSTSMCHLLQFYGCILKLLLIQPQKELKEIFHVVLKRKTLSY